MSASLVLTGRRLQGMAAGAVGLWPGLALAATIALASTFIAQSRGGPVMLYALLIGMALADLSGAPRFQAGVVFASRTLLRTGVALLGARISLEQLAGLGLRNGALVVLAVLLTIAAGLIAGRMLRLPRRIGMLTGGATAICGASAAIAIASVLPRDEQSERDLTFTVAGVTALSTLAMVAYPVIVHLCRLNDAQAGLFLGGAIHDVAQVVGAGYSVSAPAGDAAVLVKMLRVALLLPIVMAVAAVVRWRRRPGAAQGGAALLPGFLVAFVVLAAASSSGLLPKVLLAPLGDVSRACLVAAIAAVGLKTSVADMAQVGARAMCLLALETGFLALFMLAVQWL